jgi:hypothetical protein
MMINDNDCDIEELEMADFWDESKATALYILSQACLSKAGKDTIDLGGCSHGY